MASEKGEVIGTVREWKAKPGHDDGIGTIHHEIDSWGRSGASGSHAPARPQRDYSEVEAAVDRITKRVKTQKVTVRETVTEYVEEPVEFEEEQPVEFTEEPDPHAHPAVAHLEHLGTGAPAAKPKKRWFSWGKAKKTTTSYHEVKPTKAAAAHRDESFDAPEDVHHVRATRTAAPAEAWDPGPGRAIEPMKSLQSRAARASHGLSTPHHKAKPKAKKAASRAAPKRRANAKKGRKSKR